MKSNDLDALLKARLEKHAVALVTDLTVGTQALVDADESRGDLALDDDQVAAARDALMHDRAGTIEGGAAGLFVRPYNPPKRLIIVGAVHIAQALAPMAHVAGFDVTIVDPRGAFATAARFPGVTLMDDWPDDAMTALAPDHRSAVVVLTHDPKLDDPALSVVLASGAFYVGALGSKRTHGARLERLGALELDEGGLDAAALARIHGPIGLAIGARSPAEIAIAILAQITAVLHGATA